MKESGVEFNPETAKDLRPRTFAFTAHGEQFRYTLEIPDYINSRLSSEVLDRLQQYMHGYACRVVEGAMRGGYLLSDSGKAQMRRDVGEHLRQYIWERFAQSQLDQGNGAWQVAETLQRVKK